MMEVEDLRLEMEMPGAEGHRQEAMAVETVEIVEDREDRLGATPPVRTFPLTLMTNLEVAELGARASQID